MDSTLETTTRIREAIAVLTRYSMRGFFSFAMERDLSPSQLGTLMHLSRNGSRGLRHIGHDMHRTSAAASQMIERLVQRGLVERSETPEDRRSKRVSLTEGGSATLRDCSSARLRWVDEALARLSVEEAELVARGLGILLDKIRAAAEESATPRYDPESKGRAT
jgi:DNA-binding MarR family transcriptional regulator